MLLSLGLLSSLLLFAAGDITTRISTYLTKPLNFKCDALPYRSMYHQSDCYFVIDVDVDASGSANKCYLALTGAQLAKDTPEPVLALIFAERDELLLDDESSKKSLKKKALCWYDSRITSDLRCAAGTPLSSAGTCTSREERDNPIKYKIMLPYLAEFTKKVEHAQTVIIKGTFTTTDFNYQRAINGINQFQIQLMNGEDFTTIPLHFKIDFPGNKVILAYKDDKQWFGNETKSNPFTRGAAFDIRIRVDRNHFQILVNGKEFAIYKHALSYDTISHLWVEGAAQLNYVKLGESYVPTPRQSVTQSNAVFSTFCNQRVCGKSSVHPFYTERRSHCTADCTSLHISGTVNEHHTRAPLGTIIIINLVRGNDFALQIEFRWWSGCPHGSYLCPHNSTTILTWYQNGQWTGIAGTEFFAPIPVRKGPENRFTMEIKNGAGIYDILVNGVRKYTFRHRTLPFDITGVEIAGIANLDAQVTGQTAPVAPL